MKKLAFIFVSFLFVGVCMAQNTGTPSVEEQMKTLRTNVQTGQHLRQYNDFINGQWEKKKVLDGDLLKAAQLMEFAVGMSENVDDAENPDEVIELDTKITNDINAMRANGARLEPTIEEANWWRTAPAEDVKAAYLQKATELRDKFAKTDYSSITARIAALQKAEAKKQEEELGGFEEFKLD